MSAGATARAAGVMAPPVTEAMASAPTATNTSANVPNASAPSLRAQADGGSATGVPGAVADAGWRPPPRSSVVMALRLGIGMVPANGGARPDGRGPGSGQRSCSRAAVDRRRSGQYRLGSWPAVSHGSATALQPRDGRAPRLPALCSLRLGLSMLGAFLVDRPGRPLLGLILADPAVLVRVLDGLYCRCACRSSPSAASLASFILTDRVCGRSDRTHHTTDGS